MDQPESCGSRKQLQSTVLSTQKRVVELTISQSQYRTVLEAVIAVTIAPTRTATGLCLAARARNTTLRTDSTTFMTAAYSLKHQSCVQRLPKTPTHIALSRTRYCPRTPPDCRSGRSWHTVHRVSRTRRDRPLERCEGCVCGRRRRGSVVKDDPAAGVNGRGAPQKHVARIPSDQQRRDDEPRDDPCVCAVPVRGRRRHVDRSFRERRGVEEAVPQAGEWSESAVTLQASR